MVTSFITLLPIVSLFLFGGATLQDFAFAIMVGIAIGAVSTIFVATPLLVSLMERDPEWARRRDQEPEVGAIQSVGGGLVVDPSTVDEEEVALAEEAEELTPVPAGTGAAPSAATSSKRERRRQRRASRPHGRTR
jgi:hypothetical protein